MHSPYPHWRPLVSAGIATVVLAAGAYAVAFTGIWAKVIPTPPVLKLAYWVEGGDSVATKQLTDQITKAGYTPILVKTAAQADLALRKTQTLGSTAVLQGPTGAPAQLNAAAPDVATPAAAKIITPTTKPGYYLTTRNLPQPKRTALASALKTAPSNTWSLVALGDIIIGRTTYLQIKRAGDPNKPFAYFADTIRQADVSLADLECTISDAHTVVTDGGMTFASPTSSAAGLKSSGIDAVNVANNHSANVGLAGFTDTLDAIKASPSQPSAAAATTPKLTRPPSSLLTASASPSSATRPSSAPLRPALTLPAWPICPWPPRPPSTKPKPPAWK